MLVLMEAYSQYPGAPILPLGGFGPSDDPIQVTNIEGLGPVKADVQSTQLANGRGESYQGSSVGKRNLVLSLGLNPNWSDQSMASLRQLLYAYFLPQMWTQLRFYSDELDAMVIEGYVESFEPNMFSQDPEIQVSIVCPNPDFIAAEPVIVTAADFHASEQIVVEYDGTQPTGFELSIKQVSGSESGGTAILSMNHGSDDVGWANLSEILWINEHAIVSDTQYLQVISSLNGQRRVEIRSVADDSTILNLLPWQYRPIYADMIGVTYWPYLIPGRNEMQVDGISGTCEYTLAYYKRLGGL